MLSSTHRWTEQERRDADALEAEQALVQRLQQLQPRDDSGSAPLDEECGGIAEWVPDGQCSGRLAAVMDDEERPGRSASAPPRRLLCIEPRPLSPLEHAMQQPHIRADSPLPQRRLGKSEAQKQAQRIGLNRVHGQGIRKASARRKSVLSGPHERARQADLAASRYAVTTWEDILRFQSTAAATKARHEAWEERPAAWDLVLARSFGAMGTAP